MSTGYANIAVFLVFAAAFVAASMALGRLLRPHHPPSHDVGQKLDSYECGESPESQAWFNFNPRFYVIALVFLIFDVEIAFVYPVAVVFKRWVTEGLGVTALVEMFAFIGVLLLGLIYVWAKGDLEWVRALRGEAPKLVVAKSRAGEAVEAKAEVAA